MSECITKSEWEKFFNELSRSIKNTVCEVEVEALGIFDKIEVKWLPLLGLSYDPKDNVISVLFDKLDHMIEKPQEVVVEKGADGIKRIEIVSGEDAARNVLKFKEPVNV